MAYQKVNVVGRPTPEERGIQNRLSGPRRTPVTPLQDDRGGSRGTRRPSITPLQQLVRRRILLRDVWLKDLFKIWAHSPDPLNLGPFRNSPKQWQNALTDLSNPSVVEVQHEIHRRVEKRRDEGNIEALIRLDRFVRGDPPRVRAMRGDTSKKNYLIDLLRTRSIVRPVHDPQAANSGFNSLKRELESFEQEATNRYLSVSRLIGKGYERSLHRDSVFIDRYNQALDLFVVAINEFLDSNRRLVDWRVQEDVIFNKPEFAPPSDPSLPAPGNRAGRAAFRAWNSLRPRQRAALGWDMRDGSTASNVIEKLNTVKSNLKINRGVR